MGWYFLNAVDSRPLLFLPNTVMTLTEKSASDLAFGMDSLISPGLQGARFVESIGNLTGEVSRPQNAGRLDRNVRARSQNG